MQGMSDSYILWLICRYGKGLKGQWDADEQLLSGYLARLYPGESKSQLRRRGFELCSKWFEAWLLTIGKAGLAAILHEIGDIDTAIKDRRTCIAMFYACSIQLRTEIDDEYLSYLATTPHPRVIEERRALWTEILAEDDDLDSFVGVLPVFCGYLQGTLADAFPVFKQGTDVQEMISKARQPVPRYERWARELEAMILRGHLLGPPDMNGVDADLDMRIGKMVKKPLRWQWTEITDGESRRLGYPEYPGVILR
ncbi:hypothetical protein EVG20_g6741 [Dentipellis fragilis]|uniref:Uncharacterized protein n=1 Tax=Dentipellis fragilis TaxID=205917 RepID=A0A4Y9YL52_9AGAM|nr:hypothetical protein EVG20_g6741 [Dentipellis fragilis]